MSQSLVNVELIFLRTTSLQEQRPERFTLIRAHRFRRGPRMAAAKVAVVRVQFKFMSSTTDQVCFVLVALCTP